MRQIEAITRQLRSAEKEATKWDLRVKALRKEREEALAKLVAEV